MFQFAMQIIHGDCLEFMRKLPDKIYDVCITDPPYGIGLAEWDLSAPSFDFFEQIFRVSKNQVIFGGNYFDLPKTESWVVWYKHPFLPAQAQCEMIWTSFKFKPRVFHYRYAGNCEGYPGNLKVDYKKKADHPAQKPLEVMRHLVSSFSKEGQSVFDPFMGTGSTGLAALELRREFIGVEQSENYYNKALQKIKELSDASKS